MADEPQTNSSTALAKLLNQINLPTLAMILLMGGGNWFTTKQTGDEQRANIDQQRAIVVRQVRDLHDALDDFEKRQKAVLDNQEKILALLKKT